MQYLLTDEEYHHLVNLKSERSEKVIKDLQYLCTLAANNVSVPRKWDKENPSAPWGCVLDKETTSGYCDDCPVTDICPNPHQHYSK